MKVKRKSAGILLFRRSGGTVEFFLVHHGGPFWANKDAGAWTIPKGEFDESEEPLQAAIREFREETGTLLAGKFITLTPVIQKAGKLVYAWALEGNLEAEKIQSNTYRIEWPPKSGKWQSYPEVDKAGWFTATEAAEKMNGAQLSLIDELLAKLNGLRPDGTILL